ncbi:MAG: hypothetical protein FWF02_07805 [Micrococcales bacterium]|nr:hypothetical protein [Micrococcales bacterium]MCL2667595.1 hypothetical protein [Micrococcales bacterium]
MKKLVLLVSVLITALVLGACGNSDGDSGSGAVGGQPVGQDVPQGVPDEPSVDDPPATGQQDSRPSVPDSYDIRGTWKSVGSEGWGQAQPGAIVLFGDGQATLYSPQDTYAFYKENGTWRLVVTGLLGGTTNFRVVIIDANNIELYSGSDDSPKLVLQRVG